MKGHSGRASLLASLLFLAAGRTGADGFSGPPPTPCALDTTWAASGHYTLADRSVTALLVDRQGRLLLAGSTATGSYVRRLLATGAVDTSFATNGTLELSLEDQSMPERPVALVLNADDDFFLLQNEDQATADSTVITYSVLHVLADGSVDQTFADNGVIAAGSGQARGMYRTTYGTLEVMLTPAAGQWGLREYSDAGIRNLALGNNGLYAESGNLMGRVGPMAGDRVDVFHDCHNSTCGYWRSRFTGGATPTRKLLQHTTPNILQILSLPNAAHPDAFLALLGGSPVTVNIGGTDTDVTLVEGGTGHIYADGFIAAWGHPKLYLDKYLTSTGSPDTAFCNGSHTSGDLSGETRVGLQLAVDPAGHVLVSSSVGEHHAPYLDYALSAEVSRYRGSSPDTIPDDLAVLPTESYHAASGRYVMSAITISGLGPGVSVPARFTSTTTSARGWELSVDNGASWHNGWLWVGNGSKLKLRRPADSVGSDVAVLTVGGVLSPNSPGVPLGTVLEVDLTPAGVTVVNPLGSTPAAPTAMDPTVVSEPASSSGGAAGLPLLLGLGLLARLRRRH